MKMDVPLYPIELGALGVDRVVVKPQDVADLMQ
jgi:hypothetical protein